ncbi:MAG: ABC transporter ATP-binding protein [Kiritimatiellae bacterium]|nr:ABC transporter ATP-binding protein [Kiritimatiellia bacterium]
MPAPLAIEGLTKRFGGRVALDEVSAKIEPGELFFLLGPSGCGKTTLLRCVAGLCRPDAGRIRLDGADITDRPTHLRGTAMVFQSYALWPHMTVFENVAFALRVQRRSAAEVRRRAMQALERVRLADRADARPAELSGGQQQRVALARALAAEPRCLLLDEPLSNLDAQLRLEMRGEIRRLCREAGLTTLYVTHDQREAIAIADRLAVLRDGRLEQCGTPEEVYARPANRFVARFLGAANFLEGRIVGRSGGALRVETPVGTVLASCGVNYPAEGRVVTLCVRPEACRLLTDRVAVEGPNVFAARLVRSVWLGETVRHEVQVGRGEATVLFEVVELRPTVRAREGEMMEVWLAVAPEDLVALPG